MIYHSSPELRDILLQRVVDQYGLDKQREGIHLSDMIYCLTKSYYDKTNWAAWGEHEKVLFAIGFALERVFIMDKQETIELDGVVMTPDAFLGEEGFDLKSTRMWQDKATGAPKRGWPEGWLKQFMGYAKASGRTTWAVGIIYLGGAELEAGVLEFGQEEIDANWDWVMGRKEVLESALKDNEAPTAYQYLSFPGECSNCRYLDRCIMAVGMPPSTKG